MLINTNGGNGYTLPTNVRTPNVSQGTDFTGTSGNYSNNGFTTSSTRLTRSETSRKEE